MVRDPHLLYLFSLVAVLYPNRTVDLLTGLHFRPYMYGLEVGAATGSSSLSICLSYRLPNTHYSRSGDEAGRKIHCVYVGALRGKLPAPISSSSYPRRKESALGRGLEGANLEGGRRTGLPAEIA